MKKPFISRVIGIVALFMVLLLVLQGMLQLMVSRSHFYQSADILISQIEDILESNAQSERSLRESLKHDYIIRAQACSYIVEHGNVSEQDTAEMKKIAGLLEVDEIHLFDTAGFIYAGTNPEYYGYNFDSGEQMAFFKPMLSDYTLSLCQDVTPNTAEGKLMMYAMVWREDQEGLVQIGLTPTRLLRQIERNKASNILSSIPTNDNIYFVADHGTGEIIGCTRGEYQGKTLEEIGVEPSAFAREGTMRLSAKIGEASCLAAFRVCGAYEVGVCQAKSDIYSRAYLGSAIVLVYLLVASVVIISVVGYMERKERRSERDYQGKLEKTLKMANAASEAKSVFLADMSHDIRTPMNAIMGYTDLLEKHIDDRQKRGDYLEKIKSSGVYLLGLINNALEMAHIEEGLITLDETVWSAEQFSDALLSAFREEVARKNLKFNREIQIQHPYIWCDSTKIREVYYNLVNNAVKYTPAGGMVTLRLQELPCEREGYAVYKGEVEDNGIGISEEFLPYIFETFARERNTTQSKIGGAGLGLPIAKKLVEAMGGTITVESEAGKGTRFTVIIAHRIADKETMESVFAASEPAENKFAGKRILLAEDNDLNAEIATEILQEYGLTVEWAQDGARCVEMLQAAEAGYYDLILMDIQMPRMDGYEATIKIRGLSGEKGRIPIVAMTANAFEEDRQRAFASGMNEHIAKPVDVEKLLETLTEFLGKA